MSAEHVTDLEQIRAKMALYARGVDRGDRDALRMVYWPDAVDHHGSFDGLAYDFIDHIVPSLANYDASTHLLGQSHVEFADNTARAETYFICYYVRKEPLAGHLETLSGRYLDKWQQRSNEWRVIERRVILDWSRIDPPSPVLPASLRRPPRPLSGKGLLTVDDPSFSFFNADAD